MGLEKWSFRLREGVNRRKRMKSHGIARCRLTAKFREMMLPGVIIILWKQNKQTNKKSKVAIVVAWPIPINGFSVQCNVSVC